MTSDRLVLDTNVVISGLVWPPSVPGRVLDHALVHCRLLASVAMLDELVATLLAEKFDDYVSRTDREAALERLLPLVDVIEVVRIVRACREPRDDKFLETAVNGLADTLVTGDKDLLVLHPFADVNILTPAAYLEDIRNNG